MYILTVNTDLNIGFIFSGVMSENGADTFGCLVGIALILIAIGFLIRGFLR